ncbi:MAG: DMT family transporter [Clostridia bacterium]|nr:DMT family transporter [Clostridia bacterium]
MEKKTNGKGIALLILTAVVWGFAFVAQSVGSEHVNTFVFNGIRFALGCVSLIPVILLFERNAKDRKMMKTTVIAGLVCGVVLFSASTLQQYGIELYNKAGFSDSSGRAGFLTALYMVIVPLMGLFMKKRPTVETWLGVACAVCGLFLISFTHGFSVSFEDLVIIGCAFLFAIHIIVIDRFGDQMYSLRFAMTQFGVSALLSGAFVLAGTAAGVMEVNTFADIKAAALPILYGGFMSVGVAHTCQILGQKNAEPAFASIILSTESMFSVIGGAIILGETMTLRGYVGCALIFAGIILTQVKLIGRKKRESVNV